MTIQFSTTVRNAMNDAIETAIGTSPKLRFYSGSIPANCAAAATGTLLCEITCPSDWASASASGEKAKSGTWSATASATGDVGYYRMYDSGATTGHEQGTVSKAFALTTSASSTSSNVLTFTSTTGVSDGAGVSATGVPSGTTVVSHTSTTVTVSSVVTVSSGADILFGDVSGDLLLAETSLTSGVSVVTVSVKTLIAPGA
jgi:hypothetical protein